MRSLSAQEKKKTLTFSTKTPGRVDKLGNIELTKIKIVDGKFMGFFRDQMEFVESDDEDLSEDAMDEL